MQVFYEGWIALIVFKLLYSPIYRTCKNPWRGFYSDKCKLVLLLGQLECFIIR